MNQITQIMRDTGQSFQQIYEQIPTRYRKLIIISTVLLILILILSNFALVNVTSFDKLDSAKANTPNNQQEKVLHSGLNIIERKYVAFSFTSEEKETIFYRNLLPFWVNTFNVLFENQKSAKKISDIESDTQKPSCVMQDKNKSFYFCKNNTIMTTDKNSSGIITSAAPFFKNLHLVGEKSNYRNGFLTIGKLCSSICETGSEESQDMTGNELLFINPDSTKTVHKNISSLFPIKESEDIVPLEIISNGYSDHFLLNDPRAKRLYYFENTEDNSPAAFDYGVDTKGVKNIKFDIVKNGFNIYYLLSVSDNRIVTEEHYSHPILNQYTKKDKDITKRKAVDFGNKIGPQLYSFGSVDDRTAYFITEEGLIIVSHGGLFRQTTKLPFSNIKTAINTKDGLFFVQNDNVYYYDKSKNAAILIRNMQNQIIESIHYIENRILVLANPKNSRSTKSLYTINLNENRQGIETVDFMPLDPNSYPIIFSNYLGSDLYFTLNLKTGYYDKETNQYKYDQSEYEAAKNTVTEKLKSIGSKVSTHFSPTVPEDVIIY